MIRAVAKEDAECICHIYNYYVENTTATFEENTVDLQTMKQRILSTEKTELPWLVVEFDGCVVGYAYASPWKERSAYRYSVEISVYLSHDIQSRGWGRRLYDALFAELKLRGIHCVMAGITLPNPSSIKLHEKIGMTKVAHFKDVGFKFEKWLDVGYWQVIMD